MIKGIVKRKGSGRYKKGEKVFFEKSDEKTVCGCGCGIIFNKFSYGRWKSETRIKIYVVGHNPCTEESKDKLRKAHTGKIHSKKWRENQMRHLERQFTNKQPTSIEFKLYQELKNRGLLFETQKLINGKFIVDAYIPSLNLIIEADGNYWHNLERVQKKDKAENAYLKKCGYKLLRLPEHEIIDGSFKDRMVF